MVGEQVSGMTSKVEGNIKQRVDATKTLARTEINIVKTGVTDLIALRPVKAVVDVVIGTLDNAGDFIKKQAEITREWV